MKILRLKEVLKEKGLTGKELAEKVNVTEATISNLAKGDSIPRKELLIQIAEVLDVDIKELFNSTKEPGEQETLYIFKDDSYIPIGTIKI
ncbi:helix-turn-helix domain-containing protein [Empedobacter falsenii]|uniref:helix-turn-helix domain-containing protein n=1 Tax=Empedobacter falsenii TaxID=343874 RepID=UPI003A7F7814